MNYEFLIMNYNKFGVTLQPNIFNRYKYRFFQFFKDNAKH